VLKKQASFGTHIQPLTTNEMEEEEMEFDIQKRTFLVPVDARIYLLAKKKAEGEHQTVEQLINMLLNRELAKHR
jgi:hypothetical protein